MARPAHPMRGSRPRCSAPSCRLTARIVTCLGATLFSCAASPELHAAISRTITDHLNQYQSSPQSHPVTVPAITLYSSPGAAMQLTMYN